MAEASASAREQHRTTAVVHLRYEVSDHKCGENLYGTAGDDYLDGSASSCDETIMGYRGNDVLIGGDGKNILDGGPGKDKMTGGAGSNTFVFDKANDSPADNSDEITDFKEDRPSADRINLSGVGEKAQVKLSFIGDAPFTGTPGEVNYHVIEYWKCSRTGKCKDVYVTLIEADLGGHGQADFCVQLHGSHVLSENNFVLTRRSLNA